MADAVPSQSTPAAPAPTKVGMMWSDLSAAKLEEIRAEPAAGEKIRLLCETLAVKHYADNTWSGILVDFLYYNILLRGEGLTPRRRPRSFTIMKLLEFTFRPELEPGNVDDDVERVGVDASFAFFKEQMLRHSVEAPAEGSGLFTGRGRSTGTAYSYCFYNKQPDENVERTLVPRPRRRPSALAMAMDSVVSDVNFDVNAAESAALQRHRDLAVTKSNVELMAKRQVFVDTDERHHRLSELEQNQTEELRHQEEEEFFQLGQQDMYRPSYEKKVSEKQRKLRKEQEAAAPVLHPVKQLEDDRKKGKGGYATSDAADGVRVPPAPLAADP
ncbi:hypothetical protein JL721_10042 [Aureococcus anophagefferens]|nr:hypothetical protein JL721_10042 [Aureococcus anophagefferens]